MIVVAKLRVLQPTHEVPSKLSGWWFGLSGGDKLGKLYVNAWLYLGRVAITPRVVPIDFGILSRKPEVLIGSYASCTVVIPGNTFEGDDFRSTTQRPLRMAVCRL